MKIDLHIHSREGSDGHWGLKEIFAEAGEQRQIRLLSITDHDSIKAQAVVLARSHGIAYLTGVELNVTFVHPDYGKRKPVSLDCLGYQFDIANAALIAKLAALRDYRRHRAEQIVENINAEFVKEGLPAFTAADLDAIQADVEGAIGRPHIAEQLI
jgi:predicted metal-dependent phosphoesterase TrpH